MVITTGLSPKLLRPGLKKVYDITNKTKEIQAFKLYESESSNKNYEERMPVSGFGRVPIKTQGSNTEYFSPYAGASQKQVNIAYSMGFIITKEMIMFNQYDLMVRWTKALKQSADNTVDLIGATPFNSAFDATAYTLADGKALCASDHTLANGGSVANLAAANADLSETSFEQALIDIETVMAFDEAGKEISLGAYKLVVPPAEQFEAARLLESSQQPGTANNSINPFMNILPGGFMSYRFLTSEKNWFIMTDHTDQPVCQKALYPGEFKQDNDFDSDNMKMKLYYNLSFGFYNFRSIYGNGA